MESPKIDRDQLINDIITDIMERWEGEDYRAYALDCLENEYEYMSDDELAAKHELLFGVAGPDLEHVED